MALLTSNPKKEHATIKVNLDKNTIDRIQAYLSYSGIETIDEFLEKASNFVFSKDKDFQKRNAETQ